MQTFCRAEPRDSVEMRAEMQWEPLGKACKHAKEFGLYRRKWEPQRVCSKGLKYSDLQFRNHSSLPVKEPFSKDELRRGNQKGPSTGGLDTETHRLESPRSWSEFLTYLSSYLLLPVG